MHFKGLWGEEVHLCFTISSSSLMRFSQATSLRKERSSLSPPRLAFEQLPAALHPLRRLHLILLELAVLWASVYTGPDGSEWCHWGSQAEDPPSTISSAAVPSLPPLTHLASSVPITIASVPQCFWDSGTHPFIKKYVLSFHYESLS